MTYAPPPPSQRPKSKIPDLPVLGFVIGAIFILLSIVVLKFIWFAGDSFGDYLSIFFTKSNFYFKEASKLLSLAMISLLAPFFFFLNRKLYYTAKGVLIVAVLTAVLIVLYKFVWTN